MCLSSIESVTPATACRRAKLRKLKVTVTAPPRAQTTYACETKPLVLWLFFFSPIFVVSNGKTGIAKFVNLSEVAEYESLLEPDEEGERRGELQFRILKGVLDGFQVGVDAHTIVYRSGFLDSRVEKGARYAECEDSETERYAEQHVGGAARQGR